MEWIFRNNLNLKPQIDFEIDYIIVSSGNEFSINITLFINFEKISDHFNIHLDYLTEGLLQMLEYKVNEFEVQFKPEFNENFNNFFKNQFQHDFQNDYFNFQATKIPNRNRYKITIQEI